MTILYIAYYYFQIAEITRQTECAEQDLKEMQRMFKQSCFEMREVLHTLTKDRENIQKELIR